MTERTTERVAMAIAVAILFGLLLFAAQTEQLQGFQPTDTNPSVVVP